MSPGEIVKLTTDAMWLVIVLCAPPILVASIVGFAMAVFQAATQIQEQTLQYAIKLIAVVLTLFLMSPLLTANLYAFSDNIFSGFAGMIR